MHIFMRTPPYVFQACHRPLSDEEAVPSKEFEELRKKIFAEDPFGVTRTFPIPTKTFAQLMEEDDAEAKVFHQGTVQK